jgi:hypothetical protein
MNLNGSYCFRRLKFWVLRVSLNAQLGRCANGKLTLYIDLEIDTECLRILI